MSGDHNMHASGNRVEIPEWTDPMTGSTAPRKKTSLFETMTLRDYFAAKAMQTLMIERDRRPMKMVVEFSYDWADAMLEARVK